ncbi:SDR family oxidoreductase [Amylibacter sp.]|nr:SDR family oxidoreductase [Amylibacter sp.]
MRILIAGGFGFVGGRLVQYLSAQGHEIVIGSRMIKAPNVKFHDVEVKKIEWNNGITLSQICEGIDVIIHAAGMNAKECSEDPKGALNFNGNGTNRLAIAARDAGVKKFIYLSTAHVYASPLVGSITEETETLNMHPYATSHLAGESSLLEIGKSSKMSAIVLRLSNAFGVPIHWSVNCWSLLINDLCKQAVQTKKLVLTSDGTQLRDFISLQEVCRVIGKITVANERFRAKQVFNLGSGASKSVRETAMLVRHRSMKVLGFAPELSFLTAGHCKTPATLSYGLKNLSTLNITVKDSTINCEVDNLLRFCSTNFTH